MDKLKIRPIKIEGNVAYITLTKGREAVIDADNVPLVAGYNWRLGKGGYAIRSYRSRGKQFVVYMHREIINCQPGYEVDHVDGDGTNNLRENLRAATKAQNAYNVGPRANNTSGFKGVTFFKPMKKWRSMIMANGKRHYLGYFATPDEAAAAYAQASAALHGEYGRM